MPGGEPGTASVVASTLRKALGRSAGEVKLKLIYTYAKEIKPHKFSDLGENKECDSHVASEDRTSNTVRSSYLCSLDAASQG